MSDDPPAKLSAKPFDGPSAEQSPRLSEPSFVDSVLAPLSGARRWLVALSGGLDSTVLLHLLARYRVANPHAPALQAIHINHNMQPGAAAWQAHCEALCATWQLPIVCERVAVDAGASPEASARAARYGAFEALVEEGDVLFLGHHRDDQVETFFLRLLRGAGVAGLAGMPGQRALGAGQLHRPLLPVSRSELAAYAAEHALEYLEDPSNDDSAMDRNYLRHEVLPLLEARWPAYRETVSRATRHLGKAGQNLAQLVGVPATVFSVTGDPGVAVDALRDNDAVVSGDLVRAWLGSRSLRAPDQSALDEFTRQLSSAAADAAPRLCCTDYTLQRFGAAVYQVPAQDCALPTTALELRAGERTTVPGVGEIALEPAVGAGLAINADDILQLRWRSGGERVTLPGRSGSRSLKKLLQEWDVPPWWRERVPLLYLGDELLAVAGLALCESTRLDSAGGERWEVSWRRP